MLTMEERKEILKNVHSKLAEIRAIVETAYAEVADENEPEELSPFMLDFYVDMVGVHERCVSAQNRLTMARLDLKLAEMNANIAED